FPRSPYRSTARSVTAGALAICSAWFRPGNVLEVTQSYWQQCQSLKEFLDGEEHLPAWGAAFGYADGRGGRSVEPTPPPRCARQPPRQQGGSGQRREPGLSDRHRY